MPRGARGCLYRPKRRIFEEEKIVAKISHVGRQRPRWPVLGGWQNSQHEPSRNWSFLLALWIRQGIISPSHLFFSNFMELDREEQSRILLYDKAKTKPACS
eukprot:TRINITY_DN5273_c1_g1_i1.p1 TRINITY_DN5273_c1_g1~~TRINITY_DN5273_c1_g1_i1.p1  ORF type:complete len:101 (+),score=2.41 TRINITY_DN5273_c1_g1_i1:577-879(+)